MRRLVIPAVLLLSAIPAMAQQGRFMPPQGFPQQGAPQQAGPSQMGRPPQPISQPVSQPAPQPGPVQSGEDTARTLEGAVDRMRDAAAPEGVVNSLSDAEKQSLQNTAAASEDPHVREIARAAGPAKSAEAPAAPAPATKEAKPAAREDDAPALSGGGGGRTPAPAASVAAAAPAKPRGFEQLN